MGRCTDAEVAWRSFVTYVIPAGNASKAALAAGGESATGAHSARSSQAANLRRIRNGGVRRPTAVSVWEAATATRTLPDRAWCASLLFLFAAGHFDWFSVVLSDADEAFVAKSRKLALLDVIIDAIDYREPTIEEAIAQINASQVSDVLKERATRQLRIEGVASTSAQRVAWVLGNLEEAAFTEAFLKAEHAPSNYFSQHQRVGVVAAWLAAQHAEIGLTTQRALVVSNLRREFAY